MPCLTVNNRQLFYEFAGRGPVVALLHHGTGSSHSWRRQVPALTAKHRVLTIDRPGFGRSPDLAPWPFDYLRDDAGDLLALLDALDVEQAALIGHSDGATIALLAAVHGPERITKVVAEAPHVTVELPRCPDAVREAMARIEASPDLAAALGRDHAERGLLVAQRWAGRWLDPGFWAWDERPALPFVRCPVLVIHGAEDPFFSVAQSEMIASRVACGTLWVLPDVGHSPHTEAHERYNERILQFLLS